MALRRLLALVAGTATASLAAPAAASASLTWAADGERSWSTEWANYSCQSADRFTQVSSPVAQGSRAYRFEVRDGDDSYGERCELAQGNPVRSGYPLFHAGDERWIAYQLYLPDDFPLETSRWNVIMQLKQLGSMGTPAISMEAKNGRFYLMNSTGNGDSCCTATRWTGPAQRNRWVKFLLHVRFSPDPAVGFIELYGDLDGGGVRELMPRLSTHTMKQSGGTPVDSHARIGMYRDPSIQGTSHAYYDGHAIATDRATAESHAFAGEASGGLDTTQSASGQTTDAGSTGTGTTPTGTTSTSTTSEPRRRPRVWVNGAGRRGRRSGRVRLAGGIDRAHVGRSRRVTLQVRRGRRWVPFAMERLRDDGSFSMRRRVRIRPGTERLDVRAVVLRVGRSAPVAVRMRAR
jgi:hypothetical protein